MPKLNIRTDSNMVITDCYDLCDLQIVNCGIQRHNPAHHFGPVVRSEHILQYVFSGSGTLRIKDKTYKITVGDMFLLPRGVLHYYEANPDDPYEYVWIGLNGANVKNVLNNIGLSEQTPVLHCPSPQICLAAERLFNQASESTYVSRLKVMSTLYEILSLLAAYREENNSAELKRVSQYINDAIDFIKENYASDISVSDVADKLNLSRTYFYAIFKKYMNTSPKDYLINMRISQACALFKTDLSVTDICYQCGFTDSANFSVRFKQCTGYTPRDYRKLIAFND